MTRLRVLIADDHEQMRWWIATLLAPDFDVVGSVVDGRQLIGAVLCMRPDVVVSDVSMPRLNGPEAMRELRSGGHVVPFVLLTSDTEAEEWVAKGASAVVNKLDAARDLASAIRSAYCCEVPVNCRSL